MMPYKIWEIPGEFYYLVEKCIKKAQESLDREDLKFLEKIDWNL